MLVGDAWRRVLHRISQTNIEKKISLRKTTKSCLSNAITSAAGRIYAGEVGYDFLDPLVDPVECGRIILIDNDDIISVVATGLYFPNSLVVSPDRKKLIVAEALGRRITVFDIASDGKLKNRRLWASLPESVNPSGICLDEEGAIWVATTTSRAIRVLRGGQITEEVITERDAFAVALGGPQLKDLFLCTSDSTDPVVTRHSHCATIEIASVNVAGIQRCDNGIS